MGARETDSEGSTPYTENPITIDHWDGDTVTFTVSQKWTDDCSIDWMATTYPKSADEMSCTWENSVAPDESFTHTAFCDGGEANVTLYVHDKVFNTTDNPSVPEFCGDVEALENKASYTFVLPCECDEIVQDVSPTPAPTSICEDRKEVSFDDKDLRDGSYVSLQWREFGFKMVAEEREPGTGGYVWDEAKLARLFNTSNTDHG